MYVLEIRLIKFLFILVIGLAASGMTASNLVACAFLLRFALESETAAQDTALGQLGLPVAVKKSTALGCIRLLLATTGVALCATRQHYCHLNCGLGGSKDRGGGGDHKQNGNKET